LRRKILRKCKRIATNYAKNHPWFRPCLRLLLYCKRRFFFLLHSLWQPVDEKTVVFCAYDGRSFACSPKAIYQYCLTRPEFQSYTFIWAFRRPRRYAYLTEENPNTVVVKYGSKSFNRSMARAKYWVFNYRMPDHIFPRKDQVYLQCWHGTPLKRLGIDLSLTDNPLNTTQEIHKKYYLDAQKITYFISPSRYASEKFRSAWRFPEDSDVMLELGYPRNDFLYQFTAKDVRRIKTELSLERETRKILLYAPTWRDNQHSSGVGYTYTPEVDFDSLQAQLAETHVILFRAHYLVANKFDFERYEGFIYNVSRWDDVNELYVISDMLITDYSSVFFDYANLKRPILFYMYDLELYRDTLRGFYMDQNDLPGHIYTQEAELVQAIREQTDDFSCDEKYRQFNEVYTYLDDGNAAKRTAEFLFLGKDYKTGGTA